MSGQPSHEPTPRRLAEARRGGLVAQSHDLRTAVTLAAAFAALVALGPSIVGQLTASFGAALARAPAGGRLGEAAVAALDSGVRVLAVPLAVAVTLTVVAGVLQTGGLWIGPPRGELGRRSRASAWRRLRDGRALGGAAEGIAKVALLGLVAVVTLGPLLPRLTALADAPAPRVLGAFGSAARRLGFRLVTVALLIGVADAALARRRHRRALRMTRRELERERRDLEGDPIQRAARRRLHAQDVERGSRPGEVSGAARAGLEGAALDAVVPALGAIDDRVDLVVVARDAGESDDQVFAAVFLRYQGGGDRAPIVVAVARRAEAARLATQARASGLPVFGDADLALRLCELDPGAEIPERTYDRVAELLRDARRLTHGASGRGH